MGKELFKSFQQWKEYHKNSNLAELIIGMEDLIHIKMESKDMSELQPMLFKKLDEALSDYLSQPAPKLHPKTYQVLNTLFAKKD